MSALFRPLNLVTVILCFGLVVLGAYVRLSNAGLGCPDWPGCYGHVGVPDEAHEVATAEVNYPQRPVEAPKAWKEMVHRYLAGIVGLLIASLAVIAWRDRSRRLPRKLATTIVGVVILQIVFGALTVTLKVNPLIVTTHLLLGLTTLALLGLMWLRSGIQPIAPAPLPVRVREARSERAAWFQLQRDEAFVSTVIPRVAVPAGLRAFALLALGVLVMQLFLGGWVSTNYAALACPDFPACHGSLLPKTSLSRAFTLWHGHDIDYEYGILDVAARATVHMVHRYGAAIIAIVLSSLAIYLLRTPARPWKRLGAVLLGALLLQIVIGIGLVHLQLPLWLADAHNAGAALLLLVVVTLNHLAWHPPRATV
jgi:cytochrome c oxidase assembly protein subunit 15